MKLKKLKKTAAFILSAAMAFSMPVSFKADSVSAASASGYVKLNTTFKTLKTGQKDYRLYLKNNKAGWKIKKVSVLDKSVAGAYNKKSTSVLLKGKKKGRTAVTLKLEADKRKKNRTKKLKCIVNVVNKTDKPSVPVTPGQPAEPSSPSAVKDLTVSTQQELDKALENQALENLLIKTDRAESLVIPAGNHPKTELRVEAPNAEITNRAVFQSIRIVSIKEHTWIEEAVGNIFSVTALKARIVVSDGASVKEMNFTSAGADIDVEVNGAVSSMALSAKIKLTIEGVGKIEIPILITAQAADAEIESFVPVSVTASAEAKIILNEGAEGSKLKINAEGLSMTLKNGTREAVEVTHSDNSKQNVPNNGKDTEIAKKPSVPSSGSSSSGWREDYGSGSGSSTEAVHRFPVVTIKAAADTYATTMGALRFEDKDIQITGGIRPAVKKVQQSGNFGAKMWDFPKESDGVYAYHTDMLGTNYLEETKRMERGTWVYVTFEDEGVEYVARIVMRFSQILNAGGVKVMGGETYKNSGMTASLDAYTISGSAIKEDPQKGFIQMKIPYESLKSDGGNGLQLAGGRSYDLEDNMQYLLYLREQLWTSEKTGGVTYEELVSKVQSGVRNEKPFLFTVFTFQYNGRMYVAAAQTGYRDFFGDNPDHLLNNTHSIVMTLYETE